MCVAEKPVVEPIPAPTATAGPTPAPYPAPTGTPAAYEGLFSRFVAFLNELFGARLVSAAALEEVTLVVEAPVGEVYFLLSDHLPLKGWSTSQHDVFSCNGRISYISPIT